jgi:hypothetical protein
MGPADRQQKQIGKVRLIDRGFDGLIGYNHIGEPFGRIVVVEDAVERGRSQIGVDEKNLGVTGPASVEARMAEVVAPSRGSWPQP